MPGWGTGSFENEDAQNFLGRLNSIGVDDLRQILTHAADQDYLITSSDIGNVRDVEKRPIHRDTAHNRN